MECWLAGPRRGLGENRVGFRDGDQL